MISTSRRRASVSFGARKRFDTFCPGVGGKKKKEEPGSEAVGSLKIVVRVKPRPLKRLTKVPMSSLDHTVL